MIGAVLVSLMVLLFMGSVRSTLIIALTIPLAALVAIIGLYFTGNTLNMMTLGGLALVMGRLVDDPIVDNENTFRHLDMGKTPQRAALDSAMEIAMPVLVATITTVAVFFPVVFVSGMGKYLFTPLALSVAFAMFASYILSRTVSPAYCAYFLFVGGERLFHVLIRHRAARNSCVLAVGPRSRGAFQPSGYPRHWRCGRGVSGTGRPSA